MKVVLDLSRLLNEGHITAAEFDRLSRLAERDTGSLAFNILIGLGVVAVAAAGLALLPTPTTAVALGALLMSGGMGLLLRQPRWMVLANISILVAALMLAGGVLMLADGSIIGLLIVAALFLAAALPSRSALLTVLAIAALVGALGAGTFYDHALYTLEITRPLLTILVCSALALGSIALSRRIDPAWERLCIVAARAGLFFVNFGFWIGSLWGDPLLGFSRIEEPSRVVLSPMIFVIGWAVVLLAVGLWAVRENLRWALNVVAIFGSIHFYTQWFERLDATPITVLLAGLLTLAAALALWIWNARRDPPSDPAAGRPSDNAAPRVPIAGAP